MAVNERNQVVRVSKVSTTRDIITGVSSALDQLVGNGLLDTSRVIAVMFGTTHCTNAIVERKGLAKVGLLRIGKLSTSAIPPLFSLPQDLVVSINPSTFMVSGGYEYDGREIVPFRDEEVEECVEEFQRESSEIDCNLLCVLTSQQCS